MPREAATDHSHAVEVLNPQGAGAALILCEHASNHIPARYDGLGLSAEAATSHAAWDPGARSVAILLSAALDAPLVASRVSRLVYDCNRPPDAFAAMPEKSERYEVPGNKGLSDAAREERVVSVYRPFCDAVAGVIAQRKAAGRPTILVTIHSFTPVYFDQRRAVEIGILHDEDRRMADAMLAHRHVLPHRRIARNEPYGPEDGVTHSLKLHGQAHGFANVMLEVRNDLLIGPDNEQIMANELLMLIAPAMDAQAMEGVGRA